MPISRVVEQRHAPEGRLACEEKRGVNASAEASSRGGENPSPGTNRPLHVQVAEALGCNLKPIQIPHPVYPGKIEGPIRSQCDGIRRARDRAAGSDRREQWQRRKVLGRCLGV